MTRVHTFLIHMSRAEKDFRELRATETTAQDPADDRELEEEEQGRSREITYSEAEVNPARAEKRKEVREFVKDMKRARLPRGSRAT